MYKLCFYVPQTHLETVKQAVFAAGAGTIGDYDQCCWLVLGQGQFRPLPGSQPAIGSLGQVVQVDEYRIEMVCDDCSIRQAITALKLSHPYEEPAYDVWRLEVF